MEGSNVWTDNEGELLLNVALEHQVNKMQENAMSCLLSTM